MAKLLQSLNVVKGIFTGRAERIHLAGRDDQKEQDVHRTMTPILKFLLFDGPEDGAPNRLAFQGLQVGHLIHTHHTHAFLKQMIGMGITPQNLLSPMLKALIQACSLPVPGPMGLQIDLMQNAPHRARTHGRHPSIEYRLAG